MKVCVFLLLFLTPVLAASEPQIKHFFPDHPVLLGQPLFWIVEIRYPLWESYELKSASCSDLKISVAGRKLHEVAGEIRAVYRLAVIPTALKTSCAPSVMVSDEKGQTTVLNGKPLIVGTISGASASIKMPRMPAPVTQPKNYNVLLYAALILLGMLCAVLIAKRVYNNSPTQKFLRDLQKASLELQKDRLPIQVWRLLRSEMVWGFSAESYTPAQLQERGARDRRLLSIAVALRSLEAWRYSGSAGAWDKELVRKALEHAEIVLRTKAAFRKRRSA
ncbi:hypothetical protein L0156_23590 [bacterium]|nr:hypothetical protein [bacterium]